MSQETMMDRLMMRPAYPNAEAPYNTIPRTSRFFCRLMGRALPKVKVRPFILKVRAA